MQEYIILINDHARLIRANGWETPHTIGRAIAWSYMPNTRIAAKGVDGQTHAFKKTINPDGYADIAPIE